LPQILARAESSLVAEDLALVPRYKLGATLESYLAR
jgi:hypothetical protein